MTPESALTYYSHLAAIFQCNISNIYCCKNLLQDSEKSMSALKLRSKFVAIFQWIILNVDCCNFAWKFWRKCNISNLYSCNHAEILNERLKLSTNRLWNITVILRQSFNAMFQNYISAIMQKYCKKDSKSVDESVVKYCSNLAAIF